MSDYKCCCDNDDAILSDEVEQFIEDKLDDDLVFIVAFGNNGKMMSLRPKEVTSRKVVFPEDTLKTTQIKDAAAASVVSYTGSHKCLWTFGGTHEEFTHPH